VPDEVFTTVFERTEDRWHGLIRDKQLQALELLEEAGWKPKGDQLVNAQGEPLSFTFLKPKRLDRSCCRTNAR
jgi:microcin C transport system substrate-binding protein